MSATRKPETATTTARGPVGRLPLTFALLGGAVAWLLHLLLAYLVSEFGCLLGLGRVLFAGLSVVAWTLLAVSVLTLALAVGAAWVSHSGLIQLRNFEAESGDERDPEIFTARTGRISNFFFVFVIVVQSIPIFYFLTDC